jgi:large subunit ribosomal protein L22
MKTSRVAVAKIKNLRTSPRKLGLVAGLIRGMHVSDALAQLQFNRKRISSDVKKCLESAIANAENNHYMDIDELVISEVLVGKSFIMKRMRPRAKGRVYRINKFFSHLTIKLEEVNL